MDIQNILEQLSVNRTTVERIRGVYVLYKSDTPVYVGQAIDVIRRVYFHVAAGSKDFDSFAFIRIESGDLNDVEAALIVALNPRHNQTMPATSRYASLLQIKRLLGIDLRSLKKVLHKHSVHPVWMDVYDLDAVRNALSQEGK